jgi:hypothetical protein
MIDKGMKFRKWVENEIPTVNRGSGTPASDEVMRTGLQPQVDSQEIETKQKKGQDKILAIDAMLKRFESEIPEGDDTSKLKRFKRLWEKLQKKWDEIKMEDDQGEGEGSPDGGLASNLGDTNLTNAMRQHPNMVPPNDNQLPTGPGNYGV